MLVYTTESSVVDWLNYSDGKNLTDESLLKIEEHVNHGYISVEQGMIALSYKNNSSGDIDDILRSMGLLRFIDKKDKKIVT